MCTGTASTTRTDGAACSMRAAGEVLEWSDLTAPSGGDAAGSDVDETSSAGVAWVGLLGDTTSSMFRSKCCRLHSGIAGSGPAARKQVSVLQNKMSECQFMTQPQVCTKLRKDQFQYY